MCLVESQDLCLVETQDMCCVGRWDMCFVQSQYKGNHRGGRPKAAPLLWWRPKAASFVLAVNTGHILVWRRKTCALLRAKTSALLRRKTCALLRAKTSALLRRKTCAVLRARTCALFRANTKETTEGRPKAAPLCGFLFIGFKQSTCPRSQHSTCLPSHQGRRPDSQQGTCLMSQH